MKKISRREFLTGAASGAAALAFSSILGGAAVADEAAYTPGTYSATVKGYSGYVTVEMTFSAAAIEDCSIDASGETPTIGGVAAQELAGLIVSEQNIDAVSSATANFTIPAIRKAAANCVAQAKGLADAIDESAAEDGSDWLGQAPEIAESDITATDTTDLLIIGAGNGGLMAAATAADAGMDFIVCEQNAVVGDTRHWIGAVDTDIMKEQGVVVMKDRILNELARYASYKCDMSVIKAWLDNSAEMISYLTGLGFKPTVHIAPESHVGGNNMEYYVPSIWHTMDLPDGADVDSRNPWLEKYINSKGYEIRFQMSLVKLTTSDAGDVTGAIFKNAEGKYVRIEAKNVILATGGYPGNPKMVKALSPIVNECVTANSYFGTDEGMGIRAGIWAGAKKDTECAPMIFDRGIVAPGVKAGYTEDNVFPGLVGQFLMGTQPHLKVNKEGERFANESCPYDFLNYAASLQTDGVYAAIMDSDYVEDVIAYDQYGCAQIIVNMAMGGMLPGYMESMIAMGLMFKEDTIEALAEKLQIPVDKLAATVARYNELCEKGVDEDFGKEAYRMKALDHGPFYGCYFGGSLLTTCDGLRINRKCQVYNTEHKIINGLYCVGDCSGSFFSGNYPEYFVGVAVGRTMTQGRYAVKAILGEEF